MEKLGFIGCGNMAQAMISGILKKELYAPTSIFISDVNKASLDRCCSEFGVSASKNNIELAQTADYIVLSVKPQIYPTVIQEIKNHIKSDAVIIMIGAGQTISINEKRFGKPIKLVRVMPNTPALVGEGMTAVTPNSMLTEAETEKVICFFNSFGKAQLVPESLMNAVTAVSGSSPAFVYMFIESLADGAVAEGMPRDMAYTFAAQAVLGSAKMVLESGKHPGELKDNVCSPAGTTIEAVAALEAAGFRSSIINAVRSCSKKAEELSKSSK